MTTTFFRLLKDTDKAAALEAALAAYRTGAVDTERTFRVDPAAFAKVPNTPFAYWVDDSIRELFQKLPPFESEGRTVKQGLATADDFRFVRAWWEVDASQRLDPGLAGAPDWRTNLEEFQAWCRARTHQGKGWAPFAKGGEYSPYYSDIHLVVNWQREGEEIKNFVDPKTGKQYSRPQNTDYYFRPGVTWPLRARRFNPWPLNAGVIFSVRGYSFFVPMTHIFRWLGFANSRFLDVLFKILLGRADYPEFIVGVLQLLPIPPIESGLGEADVGCMRSIVRRAIEKSAADPSSPLHTDGYAGGMSVDVDEKNCLRGLDETVSRLYAVNQKTVDELSLLFDADLPDVPNSAAVSWPVRSERAVDLAFARFDIRLAFNPDLIPALPDPFDPLPVVPPATLVGPDGLPATSGNIVSEDWLRARPNAITLPSPGSVAQPTIADADYPIEVPWDGILVDEPEHPADIVARVQRVLAVLHGERADVVEQQLLAEVGFQSLHEYLNKPNGFFEAHLKRYSKSRRKAPIYWPLSTKSGGWTVWVYYPRLADKTLYTIIDRYLRPRQAVAKRHFDAVAAIPAADRSKAQRQLFDVQSRDLEELVAMEQQLMAIADAGYGVNHDDGVPILAAPLYALFRHNGWSSYLEGIWQALKKGEFDWAHLAHGLWPDRVRQSAVGDRSIAIAHGLEVGR